MQVHFLKLVRALADVAESPVVMNVAKEILHDLAPNQEATIEKVAETADNVVDTALDSLAPLAPVDTPAPAADAPAEPAPAADNTEEDSAQDARLSALEESVSGIGQSLADLVAHLTAPAPSDAPATV